MKVLIKKIKPKWSMEVRCTGAGNGLTGCGAKLEVEEDDLYITESEHYWGETDYFYTFRCPLCNEETDISSNYIPDSVKCKVMNVYKGGSKTK